MAGRCPRHKAPCGSRTSPDRIFEGAQGWADAWKLRSNAASAWLCAIPARQKRAASPHSCRDSHCPRAHVVSRVGGGAGRGLEASLDSLPCSVSAWGHGHVGGPRLRSRATRSRSRGYGAAPPPRYPSHLRGGNIKGTSSAPCLIDIAPGDPAWVVPMMRAGHLWELHAPSKRREWASCTASITRCSSSIICCSGLACPFCCLLRATPWSEEKDEAALSTA